VLHKILWWSSLYLQFIRRLKHDLNLFDVFRVTRVMTVCITISQFTMTFSITVTDFSDTVCSA